VVVVAEVVAEEVEENFAALTVDEEGAEPPARKSGTDRCWGLQHPEEPCG
jgi:hypothetical protein